MLVINNIGSNDNPEKSAILINNKHPSLSHLTVNHLTTTNDPDDDDDEENDDSYDHTDMMPLDAISPKNLHDDDCCNTKDDNCENKC